LTGDKPAPQRDSAPPKPKSTRNTTQQSLGSGPPCPYEGHGPLYYWSPGKWFCAHSDHGGNGHFYTDKEVN
jgi:hypothetical protein